MESVVNQLCLTTNSLRWPRNDATVSAEGALSTRAFVSWLRRHGTRGSVLSRAAPSAVRRRRNMNCYFHTSTVCRMRRETLRIFLQLGRVPTGLLMGYALSVTGLCRDRALHEFARKQGHATVIPA